MSFSLEKEPVRSLEAFALLSVAVWTLGVLAARWIGIWPGIGSAAVLLGIPAVVGYRRLLFPLLQPRGSLFGWGVLGAGILLAATYGLYGPLGVALPDIPAQTEQLYGRFRDTSLVLRYMLLPVCVLAEELIWRGIVQQALTRRCGPWTGAVLAAAAFGAAHLPFGSGLLPLVAFGCGLLWGLMRLGTGSLIPPLLCHLAWDVLVFNLAPLTS